MSALELYKSCLEREKSLSSIKSNASNNNEVTDIISSLKHDYCELILEHPLFACSSSRDIHALLWKQCFYNTIEEFRRKIQKAVAVLSGKSDPGLVLQEKAKIHISRLSISFQQFLNESITFYKQLQRQLEQSYSKGENYDVIVSSVCKCLLYLGDLFRYKTLYSDVKIKNFHESAVLYEQAGLLVPSYGNYANQLAVLAMYDHNDYLATYYYCRSLFVHKPFLAAYGNLNLFYMKLEKAFDMKTLHNSPHPNNTRLEKGSSSGGHDSGRGGGTSGGRGDGSSTKEEVQRYQYMIQKFLRIQSFLYMHTERLRKIQVILHVMKVYIGQYYHKMIQTEDLCEKEAYLNEITACMTYFHTLLHPSTDAATAEHISSTTKTAVQSTLLSVTFDENLYQDLVNSFFMDFDHVLTSRGIKDDILTKMLLITIFTIHHATLSVLPSSYKPTEDNNTDYHKVKDIQKEYEYAMNYHIISHPTRHYGFNYVTQISHQDSSNHPSESPRDEAKSKNTTAASSSTTTTSDRDASHIHSIVEHHVIHFIYAFIVRICHRMETLLSGSEKHKRVCYTYYLPVLSIYSSWILNNSVTYLIPSSISDTHSYNQLLFSFSKESIEFRDFFVTLFDESIINSKKLHEHIFVDEEGKRNENRSRSSMKSLISSICHKLIHSSIYKDHHTESSQQQQQQQQQQKSKKESQQQQQQLLLPEHIELRGYLPFEPLYESYFQEYEPFPIKTRQDIIIQSETEITILRIGTIKALLDMLSKTTVITSSSAITGKISKDRTASVIPANTVSKVERSQKRTSPQDESRKDTRGNRHQEREATPTTDKHLKPTELRKIEQPKVRKPSPRDLSIDHQKDAKYASSKMYSSVEPSVIPSFDDSDEEKEDSEAVYSDSNDKNVTFNDVTATSRDRFLQYLSSPESNNDVKQSNITLESHITDSPFLNSSEIPDVPPGFQPKLAGTEQTLLSASVEVKDNDDDFDDDEVVFQPAFTRPLSQAMTSNTSWENLLSTANTTSANIGMTLNSLPSGIISSENLYLQLQDNNNTSSHLPLTSTSSSLYHGYPSTSSLMDSFPHWSSPSFTSNMPYPAYGLSGHTSPSLLPPTNYMTSNSGKALHMSNTMIMTSPTHTDMAWSTIMPHTTSPSLSSTGYPMTNTGNHSMPTNTAYDSTSHLLSYANIPNITSPDLSDSVLNSPPPGFNSFFSPHSNFLSPYPSYPTTTPLPSDMPPGLSPPHISSMDRRLTQDQYHSTAVAAAPAGAISSDSNATTVNEGQLDENALINMLGL